MKSWRTKLRNYVAEFLIGCSMFLISGIHVEGQDLNNDDFKQIAEYINSNKKENYAISEKNDVKVKTEHKSEFTSMIFLEEVKEENIKMEDWMLDSDHSFWTPVKEEIEDDIELEDWMLDISQWQ